MPAASFNPATIDWADPASFYLGDPELAQLADVTIKHSGLELPAHAAVLALQSTVLKDLFCSLRVPASPGAKRKHEELETPFTSHSLQAVVFLLHLCYTEAKPAAFEAALPHLSGIARLAHSLDAARVLAGIDRFLAGRVSNQQAALEWLPLAEACQLEAAWAAGVRTLAKGMISSYGSCVNSAVDCLKLEHLSQNIQSAVLAAVVTAVRNLPDSSKAAAATKVPSAALLRSGWQWPGL
ncbi:hypothetical protein ABPG75_013162 [Micractinium tetrahymenae]